MPRSFYAQRFDDPDMAEHIAADELLDNDRAAEAHALRQRERLQLAVRQAKFSLPINVFTSALLSAILIVSGLPLFDVAMWLATICGISAMRLLHARYVTAHPEIEIGPNNSAFVAGALTSGALWGAPPFLFALESGSPAFQATLIMGAGMTAGAAISLACVRASLIAFIGAALAPFVIFFVLEGTAASLLLAEYGRRLFRRIARCFRHIPSLFRQGGR